MPERGGKVYKEEPGERGEWRMEKGQRKGQQKGGTYASDPLNRDSDSNSAGKTISKPGVDVEKEASATIWSKYKHDQVAVPLYGDTKNGGVLRSGWSLGSEVTLDKELHLTSRAAWDTEMQWVGYTKNDIEVGGVTGQVTGEIRTTSTAVRTWSWTFP